MYKSLEQLITSLEKEKQMYENILELSKEKKSHIIKGEIKEIEEITKNEEILLRHMGTFENIRVSIFSNASKELGIREVNNISELLLFLEDKGLDSKVEVIDSIRHEILEMVELIKEINNENEILIKKSLDYINLNKELIISMNEEGNQGNNYGQKADENKKKTKSILDVKI